MPGRSGAGDAVGGVMIWNEADGCYDLLWIVKEAAKFLRDEMHEMLRPTGKKAKS